MYLNDVLIMIDPNLRFLVWKMHRRFWLSSTELAELINDGYCFSKKGIRYELKLQAKLMPILKITAKDIEDAFTYAENQFRKHSTVSRIYEQLAPFEVTKAGDTRILKIKDDFEQLMIRDAIFGEDLPPDENLKYQVRRANRYLAKFYTKK